MKQNILLKSSLILSMCLLALVGWAQVVDDTDNQNRDQVFVDDLIVQGSECVGIDCANGESFGFDTQRLKENNLRLHFDDTSNSASFPGNDWRIVINDSDNGGANYFGIEDATAGRMPFRVEAGARANALYVDDGGRVGIGTSTPVVETHIVDGDSPTLRLEQNGSSGFTPQTWDLAGNETNFFVRDVTNSSKLPFKIRPGAATDALVLETNGNVSMTQNVGVGTFNASTQPASRLHVADATDETVSTIQNSNTSNKPASLHFINDVHNWKAQVNNRGFFQILNTGNANAVSLKINRNSNAITTAGDITANGVMLTSDLRLKKNVKAFTTGMSVLKQLNPISYQFNGKAGITENRNYISIGAQELQKAAPYLVHTFEYEKLDPDTKSFQTEEYLKIDIIGITWLMVNALKEQEESLAEKDLRIEKLEDKIEQLNQEFQEVLRLKEQLFKISEQIAEKEIIVAKLDGSSIAQLGQNFPNPYNNNTTIEYFVPVIQNNAALKVFNQAGQLIKTIPIEKEGKGEILLEVYNIAAGQYSYSLIVDNKLISTKKMMINNSK